TPKITANTRGGRSPTSFVPGSSAWSGPPLSHRVLARAEPLRGETGPDEWGSHGPSLQRESAVPGLPTSKDSSSLAWGCSTFFPARPPLLPPGSRSCYVYRH